MGSIQVHIAFTWEIQWKVLVNVKLTCITSSTWFLWRPRSYVSFQCNVATHHMISYWSLIGCWSGSDRLKHKLNCVDFCFHLLLFWRKRLLEQEVCCGASRWIRTSCQNGCLINNLQTVCGRLRRQQKSEMIGCAIWRQLSHLMSRLPIGHITCVPWMHRSDVFPEYIRITGHALRDAFRGLKAGNAHAFKTRRPLWRSGTHCQLVSFGSDLHLSAVLWSVISNVS